MFLKKILRVVVDFDEELWLRSPHLVIVPESQVDLTKRTRSVCCGVQTTNASSCCRVGLAQLCCRDETTIQTRNVYTKGQQYT